MDIVWVAVIGAFFFLLVWLVAGCDRLLSRR
jgi:hypothetical protein